MAIWSLVRRSTSGLAPVLSATIRFWMRVDSLKRPPTLLTIPSSFSASSMLSVSKLMLDKGVQVSDCRVQIVVDHLTIIMVSTGELLLGRRQSSLECPFILRATLAQAALVRLH